MMFLRRSFSTYQKMITACKPVIQLKEMEKYNGLQKDTVGLNSDVIHKYLEQDVRLGVAIDNAYLIHKELRKSYDHVLRLSEQEQIKIVQADFMNFYNPTNVNPYVPLAALGPWVITSCGSVIHDNGGYGMLGFGHNPSFVLNAMTEEQVMANIMTPNYWQLKFTEAMNKEVGHTRKTKPFAKYLCLNSGSELVSAATRICDVHAKIMTDNKQKYHGRQIKFLALRGAFHGRTERPALASDSCGPVYRANLASFRNQNNLVTVEPNNIKELVNAFKTAERNNIFFECMLMEPVMGEGDPGKAITPEFYKVARFLTKKHNCFLLVDSIQAGFRANGVLSITDYPGFSTLDPPDLETFSKVINAGQYPLSILAMSNDAANTYVNGIYGNTMTANPRALAVATSVLNNVGPLRQNIVDRGQEFVYKFKGLAGEFPNVVKKVQGTGLLLSMEIDEKLPVTGFAGLETHLRKHGLGVIHGGKNALRFTPNFNITSDEVDLVVGLVRDGLKTCQRKQ